MSGPTEAQPTSDPVARALVRHADDDWRLDNVTVATIAADELLIDMVATGICHTDVIGNSRYPYPSVLGHEGSGYVRAIGSKVTAAVVGDPVLLSFSFCGDCYCCKSGHPAHCVQAMQLNLTASQDDYRFAQGERTGEVIKGRFFGQSSFSSLAVVRETCVVNAKELIRNEEELKLFAPLGCGVQTGSGAIWRIADAKEEDLVVVVGLGGVGLSGVMAAKVRGCRMIIAVDLHDSRIELARSLGATHGLNPKKLAEGRTLTEEIRELTDGVGATVSLDSTAVIPLIEEAVDWCRAFGRIVHVGSPKAGSKLQYDMRAHMITSKRLMGTVNGDAIPTKSIPEMIDWYRKGQFPLDQFVRFFPAADYQQAIDGMHSGEVVKPILLWR